MTTAKETKPANKSGMITFQELYEKYRSSFVAYTVFKKDNSSVFVGPVVSVQHVARSNEELDAWFNEDSRRAKTSHRLPFIADKSKQHTLAIRPCSVCGHFNHGVPYEDDVFNCQFCGSENRVCKDCQVCFSLTQKDREFFLRKSEDAQLPKRCPDCRTHRRAKTAETEAKFVERRATYTTLQFKNAHTR